MSINETCNGCASTAITVICDSFDFSGCIRSHFKLIADKCPCRNCLVKGVCINGCHEYNIYIEEIASSYGVNVLTLDRYLLRQYKGQESEINYL